MYEGQVDVWITISSDCWKFEITLQIIHNHCYFNFLQWCINIKIDVMKLLKIYIFRWYKNCRKNIYISVISKLLKFVTIILDACCRLNSVISNLISNSWKCDLITKVTKGPWHALIKFVKLKYVKLYLIFYANNTFLYPH